MQSGNVIDEVISNVASRKSVMVQAQSSASNNAQHPNFAQTINRPSVPSVNIQDTNNNEANYEGNFQDNISNDIGFDNNIDNDLDNNIDNNIDEGIQNNDIFNENINQRAPTIQTYSNNFMNGENSNVNNEVNQMNREMEFSHNDEFDDFGM